MSRDVRIALPKGRLMEEGVKLFSRMGYNLSPILGQSRRLIFPFPQYGLTFLVVRAQDVPTYVEHGAADMGIVGKDVLLEGEHDLYEPLDLGFGYCRMVVAQPVGMEWDPRERVGLRVATNYPRTASYHYHSKGMTVEIIKLYGSVELAPLTGLAHQIVDLVSTGKTLKENRLEEVETVAEITARLVVNRASLKTKFQTMDKLISAMETALVPSPLS